MHPECVAAPPLLIQPFASQGCAETPRELRGGADGAQDGPAISSGGITFKNKIMDASAYFLYQGWFGI
jgi:hypothetical protein